jgi:selenocysteine-specific elongation factor
MLAAAPEPERDGRPRWFVDRVFTIKGAGTVATGTLTGGRLAVGDELELHPSGGRVRVRSLQTHRREVEVARPVSRVAANLAGSGRDALERGDVVTRPGEWHPTAVLEARLVPVRSSTAPLTARGAFTLHAGSSERPARLRLYGGASLRPQGGFARIRLSSPLVLDVGDRFVIRESGRRRTVAGGIVLDVDPPARPGPEPDARLRARLGASRAELASLVVGERGAVPGSELLPLIGAPVERVDGATLIGAWWVEDPVLAEAEAAGRAHLERFHAIDPLAAGVEAAALRTTILEALRGARAPSEPSLADAISERLLSMGTLAREGALVRLASHVPEASGEDEARLVETIREEEPTPPTVPDLIALGFGTSLIDATVRSGALVRTTPEIVHTAAFVTEAIEAIGEAGEGGITVSALRERLGTSRRFAVPLVEHLDRVGITRRVGDVRVLRERGVSGRGR